MIYDKATWHYEGDWPAGLHPRQAFVHTGLYLAWLITRGLVQDSAFPGLDGATARAQLLAREVTGPTLFDRWFDGVLLDAFLTEEGDAFTQDYFDLDAGQYLEDYQAVLADELDSLYAVEDSWTNFDLLAMRLDERLAEWRRQG